MVRLQLFLTLFLICSLQVPTTASSAGTGSPIQAQLPAGSPSAPAGGQTTVPFDTVPKAPAHTPQQTIHRPSPPEFSVVIDPAHGGTDPGARIAPNRLEKDLTLLLAKKLRQELQTRHIAVILLRDNDSDPSLDQRTAAVNLARPSVFVTLHATPGSTIHIYTAASNRLSDSDRERSGFLPWDNAQATFQNESQILAITAAAAIEKRELAALVRPSFVEPLHSIAAPAIAVEAPADKKGLKISPDLIAGALADAIAIRKISAGARP